MIAQDNIAVVVVAYNRLESVSRLLDSLSGAHYNQNVTLIISIDKSKTDVVEKYADGFEWKHGRKIVVKHETNLGLRKHILSIGNYLNEYDAIVVLEDDLIVSPSFFNYTTATVKKYKDDDRVAGISLYSFSTDLQTGVPFVPDKNEYDAFLFQNAQSWGQVWMKKQWSDFISWYRENSEEFGDQPHLPYSICHWPKNSWLKYHIKYCIECNKFFVYPYVPLTFCTGAAGVHSKETNVRVHNVLQQGNKINYYLPDFNDAIKYDGFYERLDFEKYLDVDDVCFDLYGAKGNRQHKRYWLTTMIEPYKVVRSFGMMYLPIEQNVACNVPGTSIFLYDTTVCSTKPNNNIYCLLNFHFKTECMLGYMKNRGFCKACFQIIKAIFHKLKTRI